jgi:hypothetical protein
MTTYPRGKLCLTQTSCDQGDDVDDHVLVGHLEVIAVQSQEHDRGQERDPLVAVLKRMIPCQAERTGSGERRQVRLRP